MTAEATTPEPTDFKALADRLKRPVEIGYPERWCVIFKRDAEPIDYCEGTPEEMRLRYERLSERWTGVVLCKILVPDASACEMGEARARFAALRAPTTETPDHG